MDHQFAKVVNFVLYQVGWFCCVLGAAWNVPWIGTVLASTLVVVHFCLAYHRSSQFILVLAAAAIGLIVDTSLLWCGAFRFPSGMVVTWLPPPWMSVLWMQFATTLHYSLGWLTRSLRGSTVLGLIGAPLAFFGGEKLGAIEFLPPRGWHYLYLAIMWAVAIPTLAAVARHLQANTSATAGYRYWGTSRHDQKSA